MASTSNASNWRHAGGRQQAAVPVHANLPERTAFPGAHGQPGARGWATMLPPLRLDVPEGAGARNCPQRESVIPR